MEDDIRRLHVEQEIALLRADLATSSPASYSVAEMKEISADLDAKTADLDQAVRQDFRSLPIEAQESLLEMLADDCEQQRRFWYEVLGLDEDSM